MQAVPLLVSERSVQSSSQQILVQSSAQQILVQSSAQQIRVQSSQQIRVQSSQIRAWPVMSRVGQVRGSL